MKSNEQENVSAEVVVEEFLKITGIHTRDLMKLCGIENYIHGKADFDDEFYLITITRHTKTNQHA